MNTTNKGDLAKLVAATGVLGVVGYNTLIHKNLPTQQSTPTVSAASCNDPVIKGNISYTTGEKIYHAPGDTSYNKTVIDTSAGEKMFCTPEEAMKEGWRHAQN